MGDPVDLSADVASICAKLGFDPDDVMKIELCPSEVTLTVVLRGDDDRSSYLVRRHGVAAEIVKLAITTRSAARRASTAPKA